LKDFFSKIKENIENQNDFISRLEMRTFKNIYRIITIDYISYIKEFPEFKNLYKYVIENNIDITMIDDQIGLELKDVKKEKGKEDTANSNYDIFIEKIKNIKFVKSYIIRVMVETTKKIMKKTLKLLMLNIIKRKLNIKLLAKDKIYDVLKLKNNGFKIPKKLNEKYLIFKSNCEMSYEEDVKKWSETEFKSFNDYLNTKLEILKTKKTITNNQKKVLYK